MSPGTYRGRPSVTETQSQQECGQTVLLLTAKLRSSPTGFILFVEMMEFPVESLIEFNNNRKSVNIKRKMKNIGKFIQMSSTNLCLWKLHAGELESLPAEFWLTKCLSLVFNTVSIAMTPPLA